MITLLGCQKEIDSSLLGEIDGEINQPITEGILEFRYYYQGTDITALFDQLDYQQDDFKSHFLSTVATDSKQKVFWDRMYDLHADGNILVTASVLNPRRIKIHFKNDKFLVDYIGLGYSGQQLINYSSDTTGFYNQISLVNEQLISFQKELYSYGFKSEIENTLKNNNSIFETYYTRSETGKTINIKGITCKEVIYDATDEYKQLIGQPGALIPHKIILYTTKQLPSILKHYSSFGKSSEDFFLKAEAFYNNNPSSSYTIEATSLEAKSINDDVFKINLKYPLLSITHADFINDARWQTWQPLILIDLF